ncbi:MAG: phosphate ABC transporter permease PstA [Clostridiales bacterium]|nr:phosphate ABC transporter permease PstA [Clostridiales bacterium]
MSAGITAAIVLVLTAIIGFILIKGLPAINFKFLFGPSGNAGASLRPAFVTTGMLILIALAVALPVGIGAAIYLSEYAKPDTRLVKTIRLFTETLAGMPSIIFGFFGVIFFCEFMKMGVSVLAGGLTLSLIILPTVIRSTEESIIAVPHALREASLALGAGKLRTIFKVVLPSAISGIVTSVILGIGRIVGESAALIYTAGAVVYTPDALTDRGASFAVMMWMFSSEGLYMSYAYGTAAVLLIFVAVLNTLIALLKNGFERGKKP